FNLPDVPQRMAVQEQRSNELQKMADAALQASHDDGLQKGAGQAKLVIAEMHARLSQLALELEQTRDEARRAHNAEAQMRRKADAAKRQKTLHAFFDKPLGHEARSRAAQAQLGEGYTSRNTSAGALS
ncbi:MAG: hypothetical protein SGPRY_004551, partial [Prymnesium sp.]